MVSGRQLESIRIQCGLSVIDVCNIMGITEGDWRRVIKNKVRPTVYQLCMFINATERPLNGIKKTPVNTGVFLYRIIAIKNPT